MARNTSTRRQPRRSVSELVTSIGSGFREGIATWVATLTAAALVAVGAAIYPESPGQKQFSEWETQILQDVTIVENDAHKASWRPMPGGQLDIWLIGENVRKLVRHQQYQASREYFFVGDTLTFVFIRDQADLRFGRAKQGSGHRCFFHPHPQWMANDTLRMFAWIAPGNARVATGTPQFAAAERALVSEAAELWKIAHDPNWQRRAPVEVRDTGDGAPVGPGDEG